MNNATQAKVVSILAALMLFFTYIAFGFTICATLPMTTEKLSLMTSDFDNSPYPKQDLTELAVEVRNFTVDDYDRGELGFDAAHNALAEKIIDKAHSASQADSPTHDRWSEEALEVLKTANDDPSPATTMQKLSEAGQQYALSDEAINHLNDVNDVLSRLFLPMLGIAVLAAFCLMASLRYYGYNTAAKSLLYAGLSTLGILAILGIWALVSFDSLFSALHSLFFAAGTWTFPANSLLIEMYPIDFWIGMALVWLISSCSIALLSIIFGLLIKRAHKRSVERKVEHEVQETEVDKTAQAACSD